MTTFCGKFTWYLLCVYRQGFMSADGSEWAVQ